MCPFWVMIEVILTEKEGVMVPVVMINIATWAAAAAAIMEIVQRMNSVF